MRDVPPVHFPAQGQISVSHEEGLSREVPELDAYLFGDVFWPENALGLLVGLRQNSARQPLEPMIEIINSRDLIELVGFLWQQSLCIFASFFLIVN